MKIPGRDQMTDRSGNHDDFKTSAQDAAAPSLTEVNAAAAFHCARLPRRYANCRTRLPAPAPGVAGLAATVPPSTADDLLKESELAAGVPKQEIIVLPEPSAAGPFEEAGNRAISSQISSGVRSGGPLRSQARRTSTSLMVCARASVWRWLIMP